MSTVSIRVDKKTQAKLAELSGSQRRSIAEIVDEAVSRYDDELFWKAVDEAYDRMNADPEDRAAFDAEIAAWDGTLLDGLSDFPYHEDDSR